MTTIPIRNVPNQPSGLALDVASQDLPPHIYTTIENARFVKDRLESIGAITEYSAVTEEPVFLGEIFRNGNPALIRITRSRITINVGSGWEDYTPLDPTASPITEPVGLGVYQSLPGVGLGLSQQQVSLISSSEDWRVQQYGDWIFATNGLDDPFVLGPSDLTFGTFANWDSDYKCKFIFGFKNFLVAIGVSFQGKPIAGMVKWSDVVNTDDFDQVSWAIDDPTVLGGENILPTANGEIIDAAVLKDGAILYTDRSAYRMTYTNQRAASVPLVFNFRLMFQDDGILAPRCIVESEGRHFVVGRHDIYVHDGHHKQSISDGYITNNFFKDLGDSSFAFAYHYPELQEIMIAYSTKNRKYASDIFIFNYQYSAWTKVKFRQSESANGFLSHLARGFNTRTAIESYDSIQDVYDNNTEISYDSLFSSPRNLDLFGLSPGNRMIYLFEANSQDTDIPVDMLIERVDLDLDEYFKTSRVIKYINRVIPQIRGNGKVTFQLGGRNALDAPIEWASPVDFEIGEDYKVDTRISYRYPAIRITQKSGEGRAEISGYDLVVAAVFRR